MKKVLILLLFVFTQSLFSQDLSNVYRHIEQIKLNDGLQDEYHAFESFWKVVKDKHIKEGKQLGWFVWKVDPKSNNNNPWAEYLIFNVFSSKEQMDEMYSKDNDWWVSEINAAHKGKTKRAIIKKYIEETMNNKYRKSSNTFTNKGLDAFMEEGIAPSVGTKGNFIAVEQLNEDYVGFEKNFFAPWHKKSKTRFYWELNEVVDRSENAYKPVTHFIFEILNPDQSYDDIEFSFTDQMMIKYGSTTRKFHGTLNNELLLFSW